jgi:hypothetical protein
MAFMIDFAFRIFKAYADALRLCNLTLPAGKSFCYTGSFLAVAIVSMAEKKPQTFATHRRFDPIFHLFALPVFIFTAVGGLIHLIRHPSYHSAAFFVISVAAVIVVLRIRLYTLKVQDRVIRLEERLRLTALCPEPLRSGIPELTEDQLIALRFASDAEAPALVQRALTEKLSRADIKKAIQTWRPDYWRV